MPLTICPHCYQPVETGEKCMNTGCLLQSSGDKRDYVRQAVIDAYGEDSIQRTAFEIQMRCTNDPRVQMSIAAAWKLQADEKLATKNPRSGG